MKDNNFAMRIAVFPPYMKMEGKGKAKRLPPVWQALLVRSGGR
jgi:hypothetical protein